MSSPNDPLQCVKNTENPSREGELALAGVINAKFFQILQVSTTINLSRKGFSAFCQLLANFLSHKIPAIRHLSYMYLPDVLLQQGMDDDPDEGIEDDIQGI